MGLGRCPLFLELCIKVLLEVQVLCQLTLHAGLDHSLAYLTEVLAVGKRLQRAVCLLVRVLQSLVSRADRHGLFFNGRQIVAFTKGLALPRINVKYEKKGDTVYVIFL